MSTLSTVLPSTETDGGWWPAPRFSSFVFGQDIRRPRAEAVSWKLLRLETASDVVLARKAVSSAYTRSLKCSRPTSITGLSFICLGIQSMATQKRAGARRQPCLTPDVVSKRSDKFWPWRTCTPVSWWRAQWDPTGRRELPDCVVPCAKVLVPECLTDYRSYWYKISGTGNLDRELGSCAMGLSQHFHDLQLHRWHIWETISFIHNMFDVDR